MHKENMMALSKEQEDLYRKTMEEAKGQLETIDDEMEKEIQKARERLAKLQESKRSFRQLYEGAARLLGVKIEEEDDSEQSSGLKDGLKDDKDKKDENKAGEVAASG
jgi:hypothetical protein